MDTGPSRHGRILWGLLIGAVAGVTANLVLGQANQRLSWFVLNITDPIGQLFLRLLLLTVIPLVFSSLIIGLAGLGNIQVTEVLFMARIHPARRADSLTPSEVVRIRQGIVRSLARTLAMNKGDKITYVEESKRVENPFLIYGKAGSPCPRCGSPLKKMVIGGRTTAFCAQCQPRTPAKTPQGRARRS